MKRIWRRAALSLLILAAPLGGAATAEDDLGADWPAGPGREETGYACIACHSLAIVKQQGLSREDWDELLDWMIEEQGMVELETEERSVILDYLSTHFGRDRRAQGTAQ